MQWNKEINVVSLLTKNIVGIKVTFQNDVESQSDT